MKKLVRRQRQAVKHSVEAYCVCQCFCAQCSCWLGILWILPDTSQNGHNYPSYQMYGG